MSSIFARRFIASSSRASQFSSRGFVTSPARFEKSTTDSIKEGANKLNKAAGETIRSAIEKGETLTEQVKSAAGMGSDMAKNVYSDASKEMRGPSAEFKNKTEDMKTGMNKGMEDAKSAAVKGTENVKNAAYKGKEEAKNTMNKATQ